MRVIGFSVERLMKNSLIVMECGISRMKLQKREQRSVSYVLMKSLSSDSTTEFGRFSWPVVQQHSQRWVTFIVKFFHMSFRKWTFFFSYCTLFKMSMFFGGNIRERVQVHNCMFICICVCACTCMMYFLLRVLIMLCTKFVQGVEYMLVPYTKHDNLTLVKQIALCI
jgi:hypothetical protein